MFQPSLHPFPQQTVATDGCIRAIPVGIAEGTEALGPQFGRPVLPIDLPSFHAGSGVVATLSDITGFVSLTSNALSRHLSWKPVHLLIRKVRVLDH